ncbi:MAG: hypothetical protein HY554_12305 [Elusimicrobia bacterium]|nr:hypothetical protein [Elusimicrobiota bacterium]
MNQPVEETMTENETPSEAASEAVAETVAETAAETAAEDIAEPVKQAVAAVRKPPVRAPGSAFETQLAALLTQLYADFDFQQVEGCPSGSRVVDFWALPPELKGTAPETAPEGSPKSKNKWPPRASLTERPRDYRLHVYVSMIKDPAWGVPGKDIQTISTDKGSGLLLLMADQKGYFLPSKRLWDLCQLFTPIQTTVFKITGPKLRKAAIARFFSLAGFSRELAAACRK